MKIELENNINNNLEKNIKNDVTEESQNKFLESTLGKTINTGVDLGLKLVMPDVVEDQIIEIKNIMLNSGLKEGINYAIKSAIDLGKSSLGIITGKFENLSQVHTAVKKGGIIDTLSDVINNVIEQASKNNLMKKGTAKLIKKGKNVILDTVSSNIEDKFLGEVNSLEKVSKYVENWNKYYNAKNLDGMEKEYKKIKQQIENITPLESTINKAKKIENMHCLIKNKGIDYELSAEEKELINKLV